MRPRRRPRQPWIPRFTRSRFGWAAGPGANLFAQSIPTANNGGIIRRAKMETRNELLLKFMLALAPIDPEGTPVEHADFVLRYAEALVDRYYEVLR
jgi:hypothetical protein